MTQCVILDGVIINVGPWEYKPEPVEREEFQQDSEGIFKFVKVYDQVPTNPMPAGAVLADIPLAWTAGGSIVAASHPLAAEPFAGA